MEKKGKKTAQSGCSSSAAGSGVLRRGIGVPFRLWIREHAHEHGDLVVEHGVLPLQVRPLPPLLQQLNLEVLQAAGVLFKLLVQAVDLPVLRRPEGRRCRGGNARSFGRGSFLTFLFISWTAILRMLSTTSTFTSFLFFPTTQPLG